MSLWLQWILAACALVITVASILVGYGRREEHGAGEQRLLDEKLAALSARVKDLDDEIEKLRSWRHDQANLEQAMPLLNHFDQRIQRLETRVFNGTPR